MSLFAWSISNPAEPGSGAEIVFAESADEAISCSDHSLAESALTVQRVEEFDKYAPGPVPRSVLLVCGWSLSAEELGPDVVEFIRTLEGRGR